MLAPRPAGVWFGEERFPTQLVILSDEEILAHFYETKSAVVEAGNAWVTLNAEAHVGAKCCRRPSAAAAPRAAGDAGKALNAKLVEKLIESNVDRSRSAPRRWSGADRVAHPSTPSRRGLVQTKPNHLDRAVPGDEPAVAPFKLW